MVASNTLTNDDSSSSSDCYTKLTRLEPENEAALPSKDTIELYGYGNLKSPCLHPSSSPMSLSKIISNRKSLKAMHKAYALDLEKRQEPKSVTFALDQQDYEYGDASPDSERPTKRRRYQRRNSKTPAMLMQMKSALMMGLDLSKLDEETHEAEGSSRTLSVDDWEDGLEIAEELVEQLRNRQRNRISLK